MTGKVKYVQGNTIFVQTSEAIVPVFAVYSNGLEYFPIVAGYASTIPKVMGQTLKHVILVFDIWMLSPAVGYVALSRVSSLDIVLPLIRLRKSFYQSLMHDFQKLWYVFWIYLQVTALFLSKSIFMPKTLYMIYIV